MIKKINKQALIKLIIAQLTDKLVQAEKAANDAHAAAVDDESVAETQYDTLAIEASYLAEGQSRRVLEYKQAITTYEDLPLRDFDENSQIALTALVQLSADIATNHWFFIAPAAGGVRCQLTLQGNITNITVITSSSPMATAILGKYQDDDISLMLGNGKLDDYIASVY